MYNPDSPYPPTDNVGANIQLDLNLGARCDFAFTNPRSSTTYYGNVMEDIVCSALGFERLPIIGTRHICFDGWREEDRLALEVKSVRKGGAATVYKWRLEKERRSIRDVSYVFCIHNAPKAKSLSDLLRMLSEGVTLVEVPLLRVLDLVEGTRLRVYKSEKSNGYNRSGYKEGYYSISTKALLSGSEAIGSKEGECHGLVIPCECRKFL